MMSEAARRLGYDSLVPVWHSHHAGLLGFVDPAVRHALIDRDKPQRERAIRHRMLREVAGELPDLVRESGITCAQAGIAYVLAYNTFYDNYSGPASDIVAESWQAYIGARAAFVSACGMHRPAIEALHASECGCGQAWDGEMMFPAEEMSAAGGATS